MKLINHQFINEPFFLPDWEVKHLLIGTFNPEKISEGGVSVNYYYGRQKNQTWKLLSNIFCCDLNPNSEDFFFSDHSKASLQQSFVSLLKLCYFL